MGGPGPEIPGAEVSGNGGGEAGQEELPEEGLLGVRILWMETELIRTPLSPDEPPMELSLTAEAFYSDGHTLDVTETAEWRVDAVNPDSTWFDPERKGRLCLAWGSRGVVEAAAAYQGCEGARAFSLIGALLPGDFTTDLPSTVEYSGTIHQAAVTSNSPEVEGRFSLLCCTDPEGTEETGGAREVGTYYIFARAEEDDARFWGQVCLGTLTVTPRELTMTASAEEKIYDGSAGTSILAGTLEGVLDGEQAYIAEASVPGTFAGPDAGTDIPAGAAQPFTLAGAQAGNYVLRQPEGMRGNILPRDVTGERPPEACVFVPGGAAFSQPEFGALAGRLEYTLDGADYTYEELTDALNALPDGASGEIAYRFRAEGNHTGCISGTIRFTVSALRFTSGGRPVAPGSGFALREDLVYGVPLEEVVALGEISVSLNGTAGEGTYAVSYGSAAPVPGAGELAYTILFSGSVDGRSYRDVPVWSGTVMIAPKSLSGAETDGLSGAVYTGRPVTPALTVVLDGRTLAPGRDYEVAWEENVDAGEGLAVIRGTGNYTGTKAAAFVIHPADPEIGAVSCADGEIFLDQDPASVRLTRENVRTAGTLSLDAEAFTRPGPGDYTWTFTPDSGNYRTVRGTVALEIRVRPSDGGDTPPDSGPEERPGGGESAAPPDPVVTAPGNYGGGLVLQTTVVPAVTLRGDTAGAVVSPAAGRELAAQAGKNRSAAAVIAPEIPEHIHSVQVTVPASAVWALGRETEADLVVELPDARITVPHAALLRLDGGELSLSVRRRGDALELELRAEGERVVRLPGGLMVEMPVRGAEPGTAARVTAGEGAPGVIPRSVMDWERGVMRFPLEGSARVELTGSQRSFRDTEGRSWYAGAVDFVSARGLFCGTASGVFSPDAGMTRGMLAQVLYNLEGRPEVSHSGGIPDAAGCWYEKSAAWAAETGAVAGREDGLFGPEDPVTRGELVRTLWRWAGSPRAGGSPEGAEDAPGSGEEALAWSVEQGVLRGRGGGVLDPDGWATRAEAAQMLKNFLERVRS